MPTYEYACKSCGQHIDVVQSFTDDALTECPNCAGPLRKVFGNIGISFKGSGFYKNDSRSTNGSTRPATPTSTESTTPTSTPSEGGSGSGSADSGGSPSTPKTDGGSSSTPATPKPAPAAGAAS